MLLTSAGVRNPVLTSALAGLLGTPFRSASAAYIPTASVAVPGDHGWLIDDLNQLYSLGWRELDVLALNGLPAQMTLDRLRHADVIYAGGGNHYHLASTIITNGLTGPLAELLDSKVWVGVSAGSMIFSQHLSERTGHAFAEHEDLEILGGAQPRSPFGYFDWYLKPHLNSPAFPARTPQWYEDAAAKLGFPVYALDDDSAIRVRGDETEVVSAGQWRLLNAAGA
jgi:dipeptidase E